LILRILLMLRRLLDYSAADGRPSAPAANAFNPAIKSASSGLTEVTLKADRDWMSRVGSISRVA
jgi:hypothetical protein